MSDADKHLKDSNYLLCAATLQEIKWMNVFTQLVMEVFDAEEGDK